MDKLKPSEIKLNGTNTGETVTEADIHSASDWPGHYPRGVLQRLSVLQTARQVQPPSCLALRSYFPPSLWPWIGNISYYIHSRLLEYVLYHFTIV